MIKTDTTYHYEDQRDGLQHDFGDLYIDVNTRNAPPIAATILNKVNGARSHVPAAPHRSQEDQNIIQ